MNDNIEDTPTEDWTATEFNVDVSDEVELEDSTYLEDTSIPAEREIYVPNQKEVNFG